MFILRTILRVASWVLYALTMLSAYGGRFNPDLFTLPAILTLALPYLSTLTFLAGAGWMLSRRFVTGGLAFLTLFLCWSPLSEATPVAFPREAPAGSRTFTLLTWNCLHLWNQDDSLASAAGPLRFILQTNADIVCLQELEDWNDPKELPGITPELRDSLKRQYPFHAGKNGTSDLKVLSKFPVAEWSPGPQPPGRVAFRFFRMRVFGRPMVLVNMHLTSYSLTNEEREVVTEIRSVGTAKESYREFRGSIYAKLKSSFRGRSQDVRNLVELSSGIKEPMIVCGDFNDVPASWAYREMRNAGFSDAWAETSLGPMVTYNKHLFLFHLDQVFYRGEGLSPLWVEKKKIRTSDHYPLECGFALERAH